jgi:tetratricopeptide (TPR) repeat protein
MPAFYRMASVALALALLSAGVARAEDADALYANRAVLADAQKAAAIWQARIDKDPNDFEAAWKRARAGYWIGGHEKEQDARDRGYSQGMAAARMAVAARPNAPEGHFWLAANMAGYAQDHGVTGGLKYRGDIRDSLEKTLALDPAFLQGSADRALGRWYYKVPGLFGGSKKKSEEHLRKALTYNPRSIISHIFLAETLDALDRKDEAVAELKKVLDLSPDPDWLPEDTEFKQQAKALLQKWQR